MLAIDDNMGLLEVVLHQLHEERLTLCETIAQIGRESLSLEPDYGARLEASPLPWSV